MKPSLDKVVPWGRSFDEYVRMFGLSPDDLRKRILGCGDGPACFNVEMRKQGGKVVAVDPVYAYAAADIRRRIHEIRDRVLSMTEANRAAYVWTHIRSVAELGEVRMRSMNRFLDDYASSDRAGSYVCGGLPRLPFATGVFELALCSHLLFTYSRALTEDFHVAAIREMARVAGEVRVFPLLDLHGERSLHVEPVRQRLAALGCSSQVVNVNYEFQRGGNEMLVVTRPAANRETR